MPTPVQQTLLTTELSTRDVFVRKVTGAFLGANIPLYKLNHAKIKELFEYMGHKPPSESACRARVAPLAQKELASLIEQLVAQQLFLVIDEAEVDGKKYINTLVGDVRYPATAYLVSCKVGIFFIVNCLCVAIEIKTKYMYCKLSKHTIF